MIEHLSVVGSTIAYDLAVRVHGIGDSRPSRPFPLPFLVRTLAHAA